MAFKDVIKSQRESGKGVAGALGSAALMALAEKMDPRNYIFKKDSFLSALFPKIKGYKASAGKKDDSKKENEKNFSKELTDRLDIIAKNTLVLPIMSRDINVMRQSLVKLVKLAGGQQKERADKFFLSASEREKLYESQFGPKKKDTSPQSATKPDKEKKGFFDGLLDFFKGGGLLGLLVKGGLIAGALYGIGKYFTDPEFRDSVHNMLNNFGSAIFGEEGWKDVKENIKVGLLAVVGTFALVKTAMIAFEVFMYALMRRMAGGMGLPGSNIPDGPNGKDGKKGKRGLKIPGAPAGALAAAGVTTAVAAIGTALSYGATGVLAGEDQAANRKALQENSMLGATSGDTALAAGILDANQGKSAEDIRKEQQASQDMLKNAPWYTRLYGIGKTEYEKSVKDWAYSVFIGANTIDQIPSKIKPDVLTLLKNPPSNWKKSTKKTSTETKVAAPPEAAPQMQTSAPTAASVTPAATTATTPTPSVTPAATTASTAPTATTPTPSVTPTATTTPSPEKDKEKGSGDEGMIYPPSGKRFGVITSGFGMRIAPAGEYKGTPRFHPGIDVAGVPEGAPIHSLAGGKVIKAGAVGTYGNMVDLQVGSRVQRFAHLDEILVKPGDELAPGQILGTLGNTGVGTGPHLHFEDRDKSSFMDGATATQDPLASGAYGTIAVGNKKFKKPTAATANAPTQELAQVPAPPTPTPADSASAPAASAPAAPTPVTVASAPSAAASAAPTSAPAPTSGKKSSGITELGTNIIAAVTGSTSVRAGELPADKRAAFAKTPTTSTTPSTSKTGKPTPTAPSGGMPKTLEEYVDMEFDRKKSREGFRTKAYASPEGGTDTVGVGHKLTDAEQKAGGVFIGGKLVKVDRETAMSEQQVKDLYRQDIMKHANGAKNRINDLAGEDVWKKLNPMQQYALMDLSFSGGPGLITKDLAAAIKSGDMNKAAQLIQQKARTYKKNGKVVESKHLSKHADLRADIFRGNDPLLAGSTPKPTSTKTAAATPSGPASAPTTTTASASGVTPTASLQPVAKSGVVPGVALGEASNEIALAKVTPPAPVVIDNSKVVNQGGGQQSQDRQGQNSKNVASVYDGELFGSMMMRTIV